jgi:tRNA(fMet)-specific endonuclease VapC
MESVILDTDVFSFITKADSRAALYSPFLSDKRLCICFQTVAELRLWTLVRHWGSVRREAMNTLLRQYLVLPYDEAMAQNWAEITLHRRKLGQPISCGDAWIAASALRHDATLITHNLRDFAHIPQLRLFSPTGR